MDLPDTLSGFAVLPAIYSKDATHILYGKVHTGSKKSDSTSSVLPSGRTLFLVNVPPDATERELSLFFRPAGLVEKIVFDQTAAEEEALNSDSDTDGEDEEGMQADADADAVPEKRRRKNKGEKRPTVVPLPAASLRTLRRTGRTAYVVFLDAVSLAAALAPPHKPRAWPRSAEPTGLAHYRALHAAQRPPLDAVCAHAETAIALFDYEEARRRQKARYRKGEAVVDEDGFTLVTRGGAYGQTLGGGVSVASKRFQETGETRKRRKKKEKAEKEGFYAFQKHEKRRNELIDLKKKWNEDLEKVEKLKQSKRFKPY